MLKFFSQIDLSINFEMKHFRVNHHIAFEDEYSLLNSLIINNSDEFSL